MRILRNSGILYPVSPADLLAVMRKLPAGVLNGLWGVHFLLGKAYQEESCPPEDLPYAECDPWLRRIGCEGLPGVFGGRFLGTYFNPPPRIDLYAYVSEPDRPLRSTGSCFSGWNVLSTFVHEVAPGVRWGGRPEAGGGPTTRTRPRATRRAGKHWVEEIVVPYLQEAYPEAVREMHDWLDSHGGTAIPLHKLAGRWIWDERGRATRCIFGSVRAAFLSLVDAVQKGCDRTTGRLELLASCITAKVR